MELIKKAAKVYSKNFRPITWFERAIFLGWYCNKADCSFCYMSTQKGKAKKSKAKRSMASILAEIFLCEKLNWKLEFLSAGYKSFNQNEILNLLTNIKNLCKENIWLNIGALNKTSLRTFLPYITGICGAVETPNLELREKLCPSKPLSQITKMFKLCDELGLQKAITIIIGLGENLDDFENLKEFIAKYDITKVIFYALKPIPGTRFTNANEPEPQYYASWIAKTRIAFPKILINAGIIKSFKHVSLLLEAGANAITKLPAIKLFNTIYAKHIIKEVKKAKRKFMSNFTNLPKIKWEELNKFNLNPKLKSEIKIKLQEYIKLMRCST